MTLDKFGAVEFRGSPDVKLVSQLEHFNVTTCPPMQMGLADWQDKRCLTVKFSLLALLLIRVVSYDQHPCAIPSISSLADRVVLQVCIKDSA